MWLGCLESCCKGGDAMNIGKTVTLYLGDCLQEMNHIADKSVDMILADLPYG
jgi:DNA modification methylase